MKTKLTILWDSIRTSFWFVPGIMVAAAIAASYGMIFIDKNWIPKDWLVSGLLYTGGVEGAQDILTTIAASSVTVAGVIFSITMVALTLTTAQFGPRLLRNFIKDRGNQIVLGAYVATFIYCLFVLRTIRTAGDETYFPRFAISFSIFLAALDVGVLVYFIHHVATSVQADRVVDRVSRELHSAIQHLLPHEREGASVAAPQGPPPPVLQQSPRRVIARMEGYLTAIDVDHLMRLALKHDLLLQTHYRLGDFVFPTVPIASVVPSRNLGEKFDRSVRDAFVAESQRILRQDVEFAVSKLVEVAVRAVSPSINDPFTAMNCINRLGAALSLVSRREFPPAQRFDADGVLRLHLEVVTFENLVEAAFGQIRHYSRRNHDVQQRLLETLDMLAATVDQPDHLESIRHQAEMIHRNLRHEDTDDDVSSSVEHRYRSILGEVAARKNRPW